eukprot:GSMAST32.ASY1.ANO1.1499.1 assembled CDS
MDQLGNRVCSKTTTTAKNDDPSTYDNDTVLLAGVFDGHGGSRASEFVKTNLFNSIEKQIVKDHQKTRKKHKKHLSLGEVLGFTMRNVDEAFKASVLEEFLDGNWKLANVGTCAIISAITKSNIYIANCGDCRAVLAIRKKDSLVPIQLSNDHNAREVSEQKLLQSAHSDEHNVVVQFGENPYYVKGVLQCTRSIGDYYLKDSTFNKHPMPNIFVVPEPYHPPYVTSNPEVSTIPRDNNQAFLVLASDGLYDELSNSEVIKIVENWLHLPVEEKSKISSSQMLIDAALKNASKETEVPLEIIKELHDDITVIVIHFENFSKDWKKEIR